MKILAIGDPHGDLAKVRKIPVGEVDLILLTGDLGKSDLARKRAFENITRKQEGLKELKEDAKFAKASHLEVHNSTINLLNYLSKYAPVYTIQGNVGIPTLSQVKEDYEKHGLKLISTREQLKKMDGVHLIKNRLRSLEELRIGFLEYFVDTCWVREFNPPDKSKRMRTAKKQTDRARRILKSFGHIDILVCHQPPYEILDKVNFPGAPKNWQGKHAGSKVIRDYIQRIHPAYVFCGHIHEGEGYKRIGKTEIYNLGVAGHKIIEI